MGLDFGVGLDFWAWVLCILAAFAVGLAKGGLSMIGMLGVPLMALVMSPVQAAGILLPVYIVSDIGGLIAFRRSFDRRVLVTLIPGMLVGVGLGWAGVPAKPAHWSSRPAAWLRAPVGAGKFSLHWRLPSI